MSAAACGLRRPIGVLYDDEGESEEAPSVSSSSSELSLPGLLAEKTEDAKLRPREPLDATLALRTGGGKTGVEESKSCGAKVRE